MCKVLSGCERGRMAVTLLEVEAWECTAVTVITGWRLQGKFMMRLAHRTSRGLGGSYRSDSAKDKEYEHWDGFDGLPVITVRNFDQKMTELHCLVHCARVQAANDGWYMWGCWDNWPWVEPCMPDITSQFQHCNGDRRHHHHCYHKRPLFSPSLSPKAYK